MYLYRVIPLTKIPKLELETPIYFSGESFSIGQIIEAPLGKRKIPAVILSVIPADKQKLEIKKYSFQLRHIEKALTESSVFSEQFLKTALDLSIYYYVPLGFMLQRMLPPFFSKPNAPLLKMLNNLNDRPEKNLSKPKNVLLISSNLNKEYTDYIKKKRGIILVPEYADLLKIKQETSEFKNIKIVNQKTTSAVLRNIWGDAYSGNINILAGTRSILFFPIKNLEFILIDNENNDSHVSWDQHPKFDARYAAEIIAKNNNSEIIARDMIPTVNRYWSAMQKKWKIIQEKSPTTSLIDIVDMREELKNNNFSILSKKLEKAILSLKKDEQMMLFISRRGLASALVCRDCGYMPKCPDCDNALVLHNYISSAAKKALICHVCGTKKIPPPICPRCKSGRIKFLGGGTQLLEKQVKKIAPNLSVEVLDRDHIKNHDDIENTLARFKNGEFNILIGTNLALKEELLPTVKHSSVVMMDTILNLPVYDAYERIFKTVARLKSKTEEKTILQTYHPDLKIFDYIKNNDLKTFYEEEIKKRKALFLPPFSHIIRVSYSEANKQNAENKAKELKRRLDAKIKQMESTDKINNLNYKITGPAPGFKEKIKGKYVWYITIKWPNKDNGEPEMIFIRNKLLEAIPVEWEIVVDPVDVL